MLWTEEHVATAVDYCGEIVPHVVKRLRSGNVDGMDALVLYFYCAA